MSFARHIMLGGCLTIATADRDQAQIIPPLQGCWITDRAMGPTGGGAPVMRDSLHRVIVLQNGGRVAFPSLAVRERSSWEARSYWAQHGDSVTIRLFTGLVGWRAVVVPDARVDAMRGSAIYLTDAIERGRVPTRVPVRFSRIACDRAWPSARTKRPALRGWERDEPLLFEMQVDQVVTLGRGALPNEIRSARALRRDETLAAAMAERGAGARVVLQFIVETNGRAAPLPARVTVIAATDSGAARRVRRVLPTMRFVPAKRRGTPVHQLAAWVFEMNQ